jgi:hypothetical protein
MRITRKYILAGLAVSVSLYATVSLAEYRVTCESNNFHYKSCKLRHPGHVRLKHQISDARCKQGRNWDYDRHEIWVDDGCAASFVVEENEKHHKDSDAGQAIAAIAGIAILGALANSQTHNDPYNKYNDSEYYGGRHSSYVPKWMIGSFDGYNPQYDKEVSMRIHSDGTVVAKVEDSPTLRGFINNEELHLGSEVFDITRDRNGFYTNQHGNFSNKVKYHRAR